MDDIITKEEKVLKEFLLDIDCLDRLENSDTFNYFDILKVSRMEIRHSNVISWLLDPNENHGLEERILMALNVFIAKNYFVNDSKTSFKLLTMSYDDILVYREWHNIDILIVSQNSKYVLCIENKVGSKEHDDQLNNYYNIVNNSFEKFTKLFLFLTPEGTPPEHDDHGVWNVFKYESLINIIDNEIQKRNLEPRRKEFIKSYIDILRRETMNDTDIIKICQDIYRKHKDALDLIYEHRPDSLQNLFEILKEWCRNKNNNNEIIFVEERSSKSYCRFRTETLDKIIPDYNTDSGWGTKNHYFYEIASFTDKNGNINYYMQLSFSSQNLSEEEKRKLEEIDALFSSNQNKIRANWQWRNVFKTTTNTISVTDEELDKAKIFKNLDNALSELLIEEKTIKNHFINLFKNA